MTEEIPIVSHHKMVLASHLYKLINVLGFTVFYLIRIYIDQELRIYKYLIRTRHQ